MKKSKIERAATESTDGEYMDYLMEDHTKVSKVRTYNILGYCCFDNCTCFVCDGDYTDEKKKFVRCVRCGFEQKVSDLLEQPCVVADVMLTKKDYLDHLSDDEALGNGCVEEKEDSEETEEFSEIVPEELKNDIENDIDITGTN